MFDADKLLRRFLDGGAASGLLGGVLGAGAVGMLGSKGGRKVAKQALKFGGVAAIGALAYHAYTRYKAGAAAAAPLGAAAPAPAATPVVALPPAHSGFLPEASNHDALQSAGVLLIRSMIAAARADGEIDAIEAKRLFAQQDRLELDAQERAFLLQELSRPVDLDAIVRAATTPELAAEVYAAALLAIDESNGAESAYLQLLASRLRLEPALVTELRRAAEASKATAQV